MRPKISALVEVLDRFEPEVLADLRQRYPAQAEKSLQLGLQLGQADAGDDSTDRRASVETALRSLRLAQPRFEPYLQTLQARLDRARHLRLFGATVAGLSSAGILGAILAKQSTGLTIAIASVNFVGSTCVLLAFHFESTRTGGKCADQIQKLGAAAAEADLLLNHLDLDLRDGRVDDAAMQRVQRANALAIELLTVARVFGSLPPSMPTPSPPG